MNALGVLCCLSLLLGTALSQYPKPCYSPALMSGTLFLMSDKEPYMSTGSIIYDAIGSKLRISYSGLTGSLDALLFYSQKYYFEIDWATQTCKRLPLNIDFVPMQVPDDAKLIGQAIMGSSSISSGGLLTNSWIGDLPNGWYTSVFSDIGCIPMMWSSYTPESGRVTISTFNWVNGVTDPLLLLPPAFCDGTKLEETEEPRNFFTVLKSLVRNVKRAE